MKTAEGVRDEVARTARVLALLGIADLISSVSTRIPGTDFFAATPGWQGAPPAPHRVTAGDVLVLDGNARVLEGRASPPPLLPLDFAIYRTRPDVGAVAFICPPLTCAAGMARARLLPLPHMGGELAARIVTDDAPGLPTGPGRAEACARAAGAAPVVHLPGVGVVVTGADLTAVLSAAYTLESSLARTNAVATQLRPLELRQLRDEELERIVRQRAGHGAYEAFFAAVDRPVRPRPPAPGGSEEGVLRQRLATACRILYAQRTLVGFLEHVSHRLDRRRWLMSPATHFGRMEPADMIVLDEQAERLSGPPPAMFRFYHRDIFAARPDVRAIVHTHDIYGRVFAQAGLVPQPVWRNGALQCGEPLPVYPQADLLFDEAPRRSAVRALGGGSMVHALGHGTDFVAPTLEEATVRAVQREELLRAHVRALRFGQPPPLPAETLRNLTAAWPDWAAWWAYYEALEADGIPAPGVQADG